MISWPPHAGLIHKIPTEGIDNDCRQAKLCPEVLVKDKSGSTSSCKPHKLSGIRQLFFLAHPATGVKMASHDAAGAECAR